MYIMENKMKIKEIELKETDEVLDREVKKFGNTAHIIVPEKHIGKNAKVILSSKKKEKKK